MPPPTWGRREMQRRIVSGLGRCLAASPKGGTGGTSGDGSPSAIATPVNGLSSCKEIGGSAKAQEALRQVQAFLVPDGVGVTRESLR